MKKILLVFTALLALSFGALYFIQAQMTKPTDFSDTQMVYASDGAVRRYYQSLSDDGKIAYTLILSVIRTHPEEIEIPVLDTESFDDVFCAISYDNPDLLCLKNEGRIEMRGEKCFFIPQYTADAEACDAHCAQMLQKAEEILGGIEENMSDYSRELYLHDEVCKRLQYAHTDDSVGYTTYDALVLGRAVCEGYARSMQLLLNRAGIPCYLVTGVGVDIDGRTEGHMWNVVTVGGENYYLDATWDDLDAEEIDSFSHAFFNLDEQTIAKTHLNIVPQDNACTATSANYYVAEGLLLPSFNASDRRVLTRELREAMQTGENTIEVCFATDEAFRAAQEALVDRQELSDLPLEADRKLAKQYTTVLFVQDEVMRTLQITLR